MSTGNVLADFNIPGEHGFMLCELSTREQSWKMRIEYRLKHEKREKQLDLFMNFLKNRYTPILVVYEPALNFNSN